MSSSDPTPEGSDAQAGGAPVAAPQARPKWYVLAGSTLLLIVLLGGAIAAVYWSTVWLLSAKEAIAQVIIAGLLTLLGSVVVKALENTYRIGTQQKQELLKQKRAVYQSYLQTLFDLLNTTMHGTEKERAAASETAAQKIRAMFPQLCIWASPEVIKAYTDWNARLRNAPEDHRTTMVGLWTIVNQIRRELGAGTSPPRDLLGMFINDIEEYLP